MQQQPAAAHEPQLLHGERHAASLPRAHFPKEPAFFRETRRQDGAAVVHAEQELELWGKRLRLRKSFFSRSLCSLARCFLSLFGEDSQMFTVAFTSARTKHMQRKLQVSMTRQDFGILSISLRVLLHPDFGTWF
jgi:hypothetical protein